MAAFTDIYQIKSGMRVRCAYAGSSRLGKEATVVAVVERGANTYTGHKITVQWDDGSTDSPDWGSPESFEPIDPPTMIQEEIKQVVTPPVREEKPCQGCGKPNDVGVKICWMCGNQPF